MQAIRSETHDLNKMAHISWVF